MEYIPSLQESQKWHKTQRNLQTGELVLIADDNVARQQWLIGRVTNVFPGSDGQVSSVEVTAKESTYRRPITKICLLEQLGSGETL